MIRLVSSTIVRPISSTVVARLIRAEAAWRTSSWAARASVCSNSSALVEGDGGVRREGRDERDVAARPVARLVRDRRQRPDDAVVVDERRDEVADDLEDAVVALDAEMAIRADVRKGQHVPRSGGARRPSPRRGRGPAGGRRRRRAGPPRRRPRVGRRGGCGSWSRRPGGRAWSRRRSSGRARPGRARRPAVRRCRGRCRGVRELGLAVAAPIVARRPLGSDGRGRSVGADHPPEDRSGSRRPSRRRGHRGGHRRPGRTGEISAVTGRARTADGGTVRPPRTRHQSWSSRGPSSAQSRPLSARTTLRRRRGPPWPRPSDPAPEARTSPWTTVPVPSAATVPPAPETGPSRPLTADSDRSGRAHPRRDVPLARWHPCST